jgi:hypothetical protein
MGCSRTLSMAGEGSTRGVDGRGRVHKRRRMQPNIVDGRERSMRGGGCSQTSSMAVDGSTRGVDGWRRVHERRRTQPNIVDGRGRVYERR